MISVILMTFTDNVFILWGEIWCWSLLGLKGLIHKLKKITISNSNICVLAAFLKHIFTNPGSLFRFWNLTYTFKMCMDCFIWISHCPAYECRCFERTPLLEKFPFSQKVSLSLRGILSFSVEKEGREKEEISKHCICGARRFIPSLSPYRDLACATTIQDYEFKATYSYFI